MLLGSDVHDRMLVFLTVSWTTPRARFGSGYRVCTPSHSRSNFHLCFSSVFFPVVVFFMYFSFSFMFISEKTVDVLLPSCFFLLSTFLYLVFMCLFFYVVLVCFFRSKKPFWLKKPFGLKAISSKKECENLVSPPLDRLIRWESVERRTRKM